MSRYHTESLEMEASLSSTPNSYDEIYFTVPEHRRVEGKMLSLFLWGDTGSSLPGTLTLSAWVNNGDINLIPETTGIDVVAGKNTAGSWSCVLKIDAGMAPLRGWNGNISLVLSLTTGTAQLKGGRLVWES